MSRASQAAIAEIEWDAVEGGNTEFEIQYPRAQWIHGKNIASGFMKTGGLFIAKDQFPNFSAEGFAEATLITDDNKQIEGYGASKVKLAVIRIKHQWVSDEGKNVPLAHALCVFKGSDELMCIALKGPAKALEFQKAFNRHIGQNIQLANRTRPANSNQLEPFALWFPLTAGDYTSANSKDGTKKSTVTYPELIAPKTVDREYVVSLWVGSDNYKKFASYWRDTEAWQKQPIWEQREATDQELSAQTGGGATPEGDAITDNQAEHLANLCVAKSQDLKEVALTYSQGSTNQIRNLTVAEYKQAIDELKVL